MKIKKKIEKILVANRGEIVLRVLTTCKEMGITVVSIYSESDKNLPHALHADESYPLGDGPLSQTYLNQGLIIEIAKKSGAQAIHPGYGLLSENAEFCRRVRAAGLIFIGPSPEVIHLMGDKKVAKVKMEALKVPCLPGYHGDNQDPPFLFQEAKKVGLPLLIKAAAGGGGKGMRRVDRYEDFFESLEAAQREAVKAFGDGRVLLEKYITNPRHIEVQVMSDQHDQHFHFYERECSIQRRNQKILEESPSPAVFMVEGKRKELLEEAVKITKHIGYEGAGTLEFLFDDQGNFYFLEMNTRLQVEHPVTEMVTSSDLVKYQIMVARGEKLPFKQNDIKKNGHAIEVRIYAEDPDRDFFPSLGKITYVGKPCLRGTRLEVGYQEGDEVSVHYDPMLAKLVVWGETREEACQKLLLELDHVLFQGFKNNRDFLKRVIAHPVFREGKATTHFLQTYKNDLKEKDLSEEQVAMIIGHYLLSVNSLGRNQSHQNQKSFGMKAGVSVAVNAAATVDSDPWSSLNNFRIL